MLTWLAAWGWGGPADTNGRSGGDASAPLLFQHSVDRNSIFSGTGKILSSLKCKRDSSHIAETNVVICSLCNFMKITCIDNCLFYENHLHIPEIVHIFCFAPQLSVSPWISLNYILLGCKCNYLYSCSVKWQLAIYHAMYRAVIWNLDYELIEGDVCLWVRDLGILVRGRQMTICQRARCPIKWNPQIQYICYFLNEEQVSAKSFSKQPYTKYSFICTWNQPLWHWSML